MRNSAPVLFAWSFALTLALSSVAELAAAAESGQVAFNNRCRTCHSVREGDNRLGPSLHSIFGAKAGSSSGFGAYSQALRNSGVVWSEDTLGEFITNPDALIPGNNMKPYSGVTDEAERKQIVDYLKSLRPD
ncbi:MAG: c-type cytochrome [Steroidobacter sp.]